MNAWPNITEFLTYTAATSAACHWISVVVAAGCFAKEASLP